jgi:thymidine phosphorylase
VREGQTLAEFHVGERDPEEAIERFQRSIEITEEQPETRRLVYSEYT